MKKKIILIILGTLFFCFICLGITLLVYTNQNQVIVNQLPLQQKWVFETKSQIQTTPIIKDNRVFVAGGHELYSIDASNGDLVWSVTLPDSVTANPVIHDETIIVSYQIGERAFNTRTGTQLWEHKRYSTYPYHPVIANDKYVVFISYNAIVHDIKTGEFLWQAKPYPEPFAVGVTLDDKHLYTILENQIHSYDIESGELLWKDFTDEWSSYKGLLTEDVFYLKRGEEGIAAYDLEQRRTLWHRDDLKLSRYPINKQDQMLFLGARGDVPITINALTGETIWVANELDNSDDYQTPLVVDNTVYIRGLFKKRIYALDKQTGKLLGYIKLGIPDIISANAKHSLGPVQYRDMIIFPAGNQLLAFEAD